MSFVCKKCTNIQIEGYHDVCLPCLDSLISEIRIKKEKHATEEKYPEQTKAFRGIIEKMYEVHLEKNKDYSSFNILATGMVGVSTRIWDKTARIMSLLGWNIQTGDYDKERKSLKDESIEDNLLDLAVYCIIALIFRGNKWGK
jgi:hypothetical protein